MNIGILGRRTTAGIALAGLVAGGLGAAPAYAEGDLVVTTTDDSGAGSLRDAIATATASPDDDRITFAPSVTGTILLTSGQLEATVGGDSGDLVIEGPGADVLTLDAQHQSRVMELRGAGTGGATPTIELSGLAVTGGLPSYALQNQGGGGVWATDVALSLEGMTVSGNRSGGEPGWSPWPGGGISVVGAASLTVRDSAISDNTALSEGGGIHAGPGVGVSVWHSEVSGNVAASVGGGMEAFFEHGNGGGISADTLSVVDSTVSDNSAALSGGGLLVGRLDVTRSTVSGNRARDEGGGILSQQLTMAASTVAGNRARYGGGVHIDGEGVQNEVLLSTVADNHAMAGGGIYLTGALDLRGSAVGMNSGGDLAGGGTARVERSLVQHTRDVALTDDGGAVLGRDPVLVPLEQNGGSTATMVPAPNSPLIDAGAAFGTASDQRGMARTVDDPARPDLGDGTDIGAVEVAADGLAGQPQVVALERPSITGTARVGETLRADGGEWSPVAQRLTYQWYSRGRPIEGATSPSFTLTAAERGSVMYGIDLRKEVSVVVSAEAPGHRTARTESDPTQFVGRGRITMDGRPRVVGPLRVGETLVAKERLGAVTPFTRWVSVTWKVDGKAYSPRGDRRNEVTLKRRTRGKQISAVFIYRAEGYENLRRVVTRRGSVR